MAYPYTSSQQYSLLSLSSSFVIISACLLSLFVFVHIYMHSPEVSSVLSFWCEGADGFETVGHWQNVSAVRVQGAQVTTIEPLPAFLP